MEIFKPDQITEGGGGTMIDIIRNRIEKAAEEFRGWSETYGMDDEIGKPMEEFIRTGNYEAAKEAIYAERPRWNREGSPGLFDMSMEHLSRIAKAWRDLNKAEKKAIKAIKAGKWREGV